MSSTNPHYSGNEVGVLQHLNNTVRKIVRESRVPTFTPSEHIGDLEEAIVTGVAERWHLTHASDHTLPYTASTTTDSGLQERNDILVQQVQQLERDKASFTSLIRDIQAANRLADELNTVEKEAQALIEERNNVVTSINETIAELGL